MCDKGDIYIIYVKYTYTYLNSKPTEDTHIILLSLLYSYVYIFDHLGHDKILPIFFYTFFCQLEMCFILGSLKLVRTFSTLSSFSYYFRALFFVTIIQLKYFFNYHTPPV